LIVDSLVIIKKTRQSLSRRKNKNKNNKKNKANTNIIHPLTVDGSCDFAEKYS